MSIASPTGEITEQISSRPIFFWNEQPDAVSDFYIGTDAGNLDLIQTNIVGNSFQLPFEIQATVTYYWRILFRTSGGDTWSDLYSFSATNILRDLVDTIANSEEPPTVFGGILQTTALPVAQIEAYTADYDLNTETDGNYSGVAEWWRGENAVENLIDRIETQYIAGYRRLWLAKPMGQAKGRKVNGSAWLSMPEYKRNDIQTTLKEYLSKRPDLKFGISVGFMINGDPTNIDSDISELRIPDAFSRRDMLELRENLWPWFDVGVKEVYFEGAGSSNSQDAMVQLARILGSGGIRSIGEPVPRIDTVLPNGEQGKLLDPRYTSLIPWLIKEQFILNIPVNNNSSQFWDASLSDAYILIQGRKGSITAEDSSAARLYLQQWISQGFTLIASGDNWYTSYIQQISSTSSS